MWDNKPLVSILIPVYNREKYISEAIDSAISQTYKKIEIIIVDNCSTDNTWSILENYANKDPRIHIFKNIQNLGPVLNWQECFKRAKGEFSKILWSDDWMTSDFIEKTINAFKDNIAFVISNYQITTGKEVLVESLFSKTKYTQKEYLENMLLYNSERFPISPGCAIFRTLDLLKNFLIDIPNDDALDSKKNGAGNDLLIFLNIAKRYSYIATITNAKSYFRYHDESFSISNLNIYYEWAEVYFINKELKNTYIENAKKYILFKLMLNNSIYRNVYKKLAFNLNFLNGILCLKKLKSKILF